MEDIYEIRATFPHVTADLLDALGITNDMEKFEARGDMLRVGAANYRFQAIYVTVMLGKCGEENESVGQ